MPKSDNKIGLESDGSSSHTNRHAQYTVPQERSTSGRTSHRGIQTASLDRLDPTYSRLITSIGRASEARQRVPEAPVFHPHEYTSRHPCAANSDPGPSTSINTEPLRPLEHTIDQNTFTAPNSTSFISQSPIEAKPIVTSASTLVPKHQKSASEPATTRPKQQSPPAALNVTTTLDRSPNDRRSTQGFMWGSQMFRVDIHAKQSNEDEIMDIMRRAQILPASRNNDGQMREQKIYWKASPSYRGHLSFNIPEDADRCVALLNRRKLKDGSTITAWTKTNGKITIGVPNPDDPRILRICQAHLRDPIGRGTQLSVFQKDGSGVQITFDNVYIFHEFDFNKFNGCLYACELLPRDVFNP